MLAIVSISYTFNFKEFSFVEVMLEYPKIKNLQKLPAMWYVQTFHLACIINLINVLMYAY